MAVIALQHFALHDFGFLAVLSVNALTCFCSFLCQSLLCSSVLCSSFLCSLLLLCISVLWQSFLRQSFPCCSFPCSSFPCSSFPWSSFPCWLLLSSSFLWFSYIFPWQIFCFF